MGLFSSLAGDQPQSDRICYKGVLKESPTTKQRRKISNFLPIKKNNTLAIRYILNSGSVGWSLKHLILFITFASRARKNRTKA